MNNPKGKIKRIAERDGMKCWLCGHEIELTAERKMQASLDHFVPRKYGGKNSLENLRLAHIYCNSIREFKFPHTMVFSIDQIEMYTNRNAVTGGLSRSALRAVRKINPAQLEAYNER